LPVKAQVSDVFWASGRFLGQRDAKQQIARAEFDQAGQRLSKEFRVVRLKLPHRR
jgi:hypothetical protein